MSRSPAPPPRASHVPAGVAARPPRSPRSPQPSDPAPPELPATRLSLRVGAACAVVGALGIFFGNFLHPMPPADRESMLRLVAAHPAWPAIHFPTMFFALAMLLGLIALTDSMPAGGAGVLARLGRTVAQAGVPVMLVGVAIDGFGFSALADGWAAAPAEQRAAIVHAADAVVLAETGVLHAWVSVFLGVTFLLYGAAVACGRAYPRPLGWFGLAGGAGCLVSGAAGFLRLPFDLPFPVFGTLILAWLFAMGLLMARRASGALGGTTGPAPQSAELRGAAPVA